MSTTTKDYTVIQNAILQKLNLPLKAFGLFCLIASLPAEWTFSLRGLAAINTDGITSIRSAVSALEKEGLLKKFTVRDQLGKASYTKYHLTYPSVENNNFTMIPNQIFRDKSISLRAKGLFCLVSSLPQEHWRFSALGLTTRCKDGKDALSRALKELEDKRYLLRCRQRDNSGKYLKSTYYLTLTVKQSNQTLHKPAAKVTSIKQRGRTSAERPTSLVPHATHPQAEYPKPALPSAGFETLYNNKISTKKKSNTNHSRQEGKITFQEIQTRIRAIIEYHVLLERYMSDQALINVMVNIITEAYICKRRYFMINGCSYEKQDVLSRFETLDFEQVELVLLAVKRRENETKIRDLKSYLLTCLFNASTEYQRVLLAM